MLGCLPGLCTKLSVLCFYLGLAQHSKFRAICYFFMAYLITIYSILVLIAIFGCSPISGSWDSETGLHATCITNETFYYTIACNNTMADIFVLLLPIPILLQLKQRTRAKLALITMFKMGFLWVARRPYPRACTFSYTAQRHRG